MGTQTGKSTHHALNGPVRIGDLWLNSNTVDNAYTGTVRSASTYKHGQWGLVRRGHRERHGCALQRGKFVRHGLNRW